MSSQKKLGKNFWLLRVAQVTSVFADQLVLLAFPLYLLNVTQSATSVGMVLGVSNLVGLVLLLIVGCCGDRLQRKHLIVGGNLLKSFVWLLMFLCLGKLTLIHLMVLYLFIVIGGAIVSAGATGLLPEIINLDNLNQGVALVFSSNAIVKISAGLFTLVLINYLGLACIFFVISFGYLLGALLVIPLVCVQAKKESYDWVSLVGTWKNDFFIGIRYIFNTLEYRKLFLSTFWLQMIVGALQLALPVIVKNNFHAGSSFYAYLVTCGGVGAVIAALVIPCCVSKIKTNKLVLINLLLVTIILLSITVNENKYFLLLQNTLIAIGVFGINIILQGSLLKLIPEYLRARTFTLIYFLEGVAAQLTLLVTGWVIDHMGLGITFFMLGLGLLTLTILTTKFQVFNFLWRAENQLLS